MEARGLRFSESNSIVLSKKDKGTAKNYRFVLLSTLNFTMIANGFYQKL